MGPMDLDKWAFIISIIRLVMDAAKWVWEWWRPKRKP